MAIAFKLENQLLPVPGLSTKTPRSHQRTELCICARLYNLYLNLCAKGSFVAIILQRSPQQQAVSVIHLYYINPPQYRSRRLAHH